MYYLTSNLIACIIDSCDSVTRFRILPPCPAIVCEISSADKLFTINRLLIDSCKYPEELGLYFYQLAIDNGAKYFRDAYSVACDYKHLWAIKRIAERPAGDIDMFDLINHIPSPGVIVRKGLSTHDDKIIRYIIDFTNNDIRYGSKFWKDVIAFAIGENGLIDRIVGKLMRRDEYAQILNGAAYGGYLNIVEMLFPTIQHVASKIISAAAFAGRGNQRHVVDYFLQKNIPTLASYVFCGATLHNHIELMEYLHARGDIDMSIAYEEVYRMDLLEAFNTLYKIEPPSRGMCSFIATHPIDTRVSNRMKELGLI